MKQAESEGRQKAEATRPPPRFHHKGGGNGNCMSAGSTNQVGQNTAASAEACKPQTHQSTSRWDKPDPDNTRFEKPEKKHYGNQHPRNKQCGRWPQHATMPSSQISENVSGQAKNEATGQTSPPDNQQKGGPSFIPQLPFNGMMPSPFPFPLPPPPVILHFRCSLG